MGSERGAASPGGLLFGQAGRRHFDAAHWQRLRSCSARVQAAKGQAPARAALARIFMVSERGFDKVGSVKWSLEPHQRQ